MASSRWKSNWTTTYEEDIIEHMKIKRMEDVGLRKRQTKTVGCEDLDNDS